MVKAKVSRFQTPKADPVDHNDHIWVAIGEGWECVLCGAVTTEPPPYPTDPDWQRQLAPYKGPLCL